MTFSDHIRCIAGRCLYWLRQLHSIRHTLTTETTTALVNALVISRIDYCNAVLTGVHDIYLRQLKGVLNAAARLIVHKKYDSITSTLRDVMHWLPIQQRVDYKLGVLMFNCLHNLAPGYLTTMCHAVSENPGRHNLRSAVHRDLMVSTTRTVRYGPRSFAVAGPSIWSRRFVATGLNMELLASVNGNQQLPITFIGRYLKTELYCRTYNRPLAHL